MKKANRICAILGVIFLLGLYVASFIGAIISTPHSAALFQASVFCTIVIPILIYGFTVVSKVLSGKNNDPMQDKTNKK
ncbi:hypothetical protein lbkm_0016 [Lachnospiraceae bacterium KM106-2]|nr:hypothetical protein lbkm_0016 [Lachnospiraceae bacterium KM106-2]